MIKKADMGVLPVGDPTSLQGNLNYVLHDTPPETDSEAHGIKTPQPNVKIGPNVDKPEIYRNEDLFPTVLPSDALINNNNKSNTVDSGNKQVGDIDLAAKANRSSKGSWSTTMNEQQFAKVNSIDELVKIADLLPGGKGDNLDHDIIPKKEMELGKEIESEHTPKKDIQEEIVADHEQETIEATGKPEYYQKYLIPMEEKMKKEHSFKGIQTIDDLVK